MIVSAPRTVLSPASLLFLLLLFFVETGDRLFMLDVPQSLVR